MSKDMKLIMENWRKNIAQESQSKLITVGDLKKALKDALGAKRTDIAKQGATKTAVGILLDLVPGAGTASNILQTVVDIYKLPDAKRTNTGLDFLNVDDEVSAVLDDRVENQFIKDYLEKFKNVPDTVKLGRMDMTKMLTDFIEEKYSQTKVEKGMKK